LAKIPDNIAVISEFSNPGLYGALIGRNECVAVWTCRYGIRIPWVGEWNCGEDPCSLILDSCNKTNMTANWLVAVLEKLSIVGMNL